MIASDVPGDVPVADGDSTVDVPTLPGLAASLLREAHRIAGEVLQGDLIELCEARVRMLLGLEVGSVALRIVSVGNYPTSSLYSETERLALEYAEQYVVDVASMPEDLVAKLQNRIGPQALYGLTLAIYVADQLARWAVTTSTRPGLGTERNDEH